MNVQKRKMCASGIVPIFSKIFKTLKNEHFFIAILMCLKINKIKYQLVNNGDTGDDLHV